MNTLALIELRRRDRLRRRWLVAGEFAAQFFAGVATVVFILACVT